MRDCKDRRHVTHMQVSYGLYWYERTRGPHAVIWSSEELKAQVLETQFGGLLFLTVDLCLLLYSPALNLFILFIPPPFPSLLLQLQISIGSEIFAALKTATKEISPPWSLCLPLFLSYVTCCIRAPQIYPKLFFKRQYFFYPVFNLHGKKERQSVCRWQFQTSSCVV